MLITAVLLAVACAGSGDVVRGVADVVDGDTLVVEGVKVRLHAIDAPEADQPCWNAAGKRYPCGQDVTRALRELVGGRRVTCRREDTDRYGRTVARCFLGRLEINRALVGAGGAFAYTRYGADYADVEEDARRHLRGIFGGHVDAPEAWRRLDADGKAARIAEVDRALRRDPTGALVTPLR